MTSRSEHNLTEIVDRVTRIIHARHHDPTEAPVAFDDLPPNVRMNIKQTFMPVILATLDVVDREQVHIISDIEGERVEVYADESEAQVRAAELNAMKGEGWAWYDSHVVLPQGARPKHPHHGF